MVGRPDLVRRPYVAHPCFNVYTAGLLDGGAGVVVTSRNPTFPEVVKTIN